MYHAGMGMGFLQKHSNVIANGLLLAVVGVVILMMPQAMSMDPDDMKAPPGATRHERYDRIAGFRPMGIADHPEIRVWTETVGDDPRIVRGALITPTTISRYELTTGAGGKRSVGESTQINTQVAAEIIALFDELKKLDQSVMFCEGEADNMLISGMADTRTFEISTTGACGAKTPDAVKRLQALLKKAPRTPG